MSARADALVSAVPLEKGVAALAARRGPASDRPALKPNLIVRRIVQMGEVNWVVKDADATKYYSFDDATWGLIQLFDGTRTLPEIHETYQAQVAEPIDASLVPEYEEMLKSMDLLRKSTVERNLEALDWIKDARRRTAEQKAEGFDIFLIPFHVFDPNEFMNRTQKYVRWIWRPATVAIALFFIAMMTGVIVRHFGTIWAETLELYAFLRKPFWDAVQFFVILCFIGLIHEMAHGYVCKFYGGDVHDIGVALLYFMPAFYCDTTDALLFENKWHRLWVVLAGMYIEAIICCGAVFLWVASYPDTLLHELAYKLMLFTGISTLFFNINPLRKVDGYHALASVIEIPELREDSIEYLGTLLKRHVLRLNVEVPVLSRRKRRIFLVYAPLALGFTVFIMVFIAKLFYNFYARFFPNVALVLLILTLLRLFRKDVRAFLQGVRLVYLDKKELLMSQRARKSLVGGAVALGLLLVVPWAPWRLETPARLEPWTEVLLEAPDGGTVLDVRAREGDRVEKGQVVALLDSPAVSAGLARAAAEREGFERQTSREREAADPGAVFHAQSRETAAAATVAWESARLDRLSVRSPISGTVLTHRTEDLAGRFLPAGATIARIGDCTRLRAEIPVSERLVSYLRPGAPVSMQLAARPGSILRGSIAQIGAAARDLPATPDGKDQTLHPGEMPERFVAVAVFDNANGSGLPGMTGRAKIWLGRPSLLWRTWRVLRHWLQTIVWW